MFKARLLIDTHVLLVSPVNRANSCTKACMGKLPGALAVAFRLHADRVGQTERIAIVSVDPVFDGYGVMRIW